MEVSHYKRNELLSLLDFFDKQMSSLDNIIQLSESALANAEIEIEEYLRLEEEHLMHGKHIARTLAELQKINEKIKYLTSK